MLVPLDRTSVNVAQRPLKVLQFGEGNFLRAFVDWIIEELNEQTSFNGDVLIIQPLASGLGGMLNKQDGLYHLFLHGIKDGRTVQERKLITSVQGVMNPFEDFHGFLKSAEETTFKFIVSNTTEAGIVFHEQDTDMTALAQTFPGKLTQWLYHRFVFSNGASDSGMIILPCELIDKNGDALKRTVLQYANLWNLPQRFTMWIESANTFCNTLVDRIVPGFPKDTAEELQQEIGFQDSLMVKAEPFHLWVIEGPEWIKNHLPVDRTGLQVKFTDNLSAYRTRKVRILNGAHTSIVPIAYLKGLRTVQETVEHPDVSGELRTIIFDEIIPTLDLPREELESFANSVLERFRNPFIRHELISIALNSISKFKVRVLPSLLEYRERKGQLPHGLIHSFTMLIRFYRGDYAGERVPLNDSADILEFFKQMESLPVEDAVHKILESKILWDMDLTQVPGLEQRILKEFATTSSLKSVTS
jgi:tagaturonate reductase